MSQRYELLYIIPASLTDEEVAGVETKVSGLIVKYQASVESTKRLGKLKLTYPIKKQRHGHYVLVAFHADAPMVAKIDEALRITNEVLRHLILKAEELGEAKYDMVQFTEVNVETKDDRARRRERETREAPVKEESIKSGVAALEETKQPEVEPVAVGALSSEELDKKIETALSEDIKDV